MQKEERKRKLLTQVITQPLSGVDLSSASRSMSRELKARSEPIFESGERRGNDNAYSVERNRSDSQKRHRGRKHHGHLCNHLIVVNEQERKGSLLPAYTRVLRWEPNAVGVWRLVSGQ